VAAPVLGAAATGRGCAVTTAGAAGAAEILAESKGGEGARRSRRKPKTSTTES